jgi:pimeloyl-ACP methyl ester carboxylesterase
MPAPFEQLPFRDVPEAPRLPHPYFETPFRDVEMESASLGPLKIHVRETGSGPPLLLIHGLMTTSYSWRYVLEPLSRHFRLIMPDLPGAGRSSMPADRSFHPDNLADWVVELAAKLGITGAPVVGNSMGGYLCMRAALRHPGAFTRVINIHSPAFPHLKLRALGAALAVPGSRALLRYLVKRDPLRWAHKNAHYHDETLKSLEEAREYGLPLATEDGLTCFKKFMGETLSPARMSDFVRDLKQRQAPFPVPLLLLYSRRDPLVDPANGERLAALIPDAQLKWLEETSHFAHVDTPEPVVAAIRAFLS